MVAATVLLALFLVNFKLDRRIQHDEVRRRKGGLFQSGSSDNSSTDNEDDDDIAPSIPPNVGIPKMISYGLQGRSPPSQRKAIGRSKTGSTSAFMCNNCGSEFVKWVGRCPTCKEWNTVQEFRVGRDVGGTNSRIPMFSSGKGSTWLPMNGPRPGSNINGENIIAPLSPQPLSAFATDSENRPNNRRILIPEHDDMNRILGGGFLQGSLTLIGGDPGVGKSTLLLQVAASLAGSWNYQSRGIGMGPGDENTSNDHGKKVMYVSGEENAWQILSRAERMGIGMAVQDDNLLLLCDTDVDLIAETVVAQTFSQHQSDKEEYQGGSETKPVSLIIIDSIQTMVCEAGGSSAAGGITQVRESVALFLRLAKSTGIPILLVGHVTKSGDVAGPRTVEHMVDCVIYLEGDRTGHNSNIRMLRTTKNRFGSADEVGVYEMSTSGTYGGGVLVPVTDPSSLFLATRMDSQDVDGCAVAIVMEGSRTIATEIQSLVSRSMGASYGRRTTDGLSNSRIQLILAVLQKRLGLSFRNADVFVNVVGGMRLNSRSSNDGSSADLAVCAALVSSLLEIPVRSDTVFVGEIGLIGELRPIRGLQKRIDEAQRMGFSRIITPSKYMNRKFKGSSGNARVRDGGGIEVHECSTLYEALNVGLAMPIPKGKRRAKGQKEEGQMRPRGEHREIYDDEEYDDSVFGL